MSEQLRVAMASASAINEVIQDYDSIGPCYKAEPRLNRAIRDKALIVVNGLMLVKVVGDINGIALREEALRGGKTRLDVWYEIDYGQSGWDKKKAIRQAFAQGETHVDLGGVTVWKELRDVELEALDITGSLSEKAEDAAAGLVRGAPMPDGQTREEYMYCNRSIV